MWQIHSWDQERKTGTVRAPHVGPLPFGAAQNPDGTTDFVMGEEVVVTLACDPGDYRVESVREVRPRSQPEGTHCADFDVLADSDGAFAWFEEEAGTLELEFSRNAPAVFVRFGGVTYWSGPHDEWTHDRPLLRFASAEEVWSQELPVSEGIAYCLVEVPIRWFDDVKPPLFIVAKSVSVDTDSSNE